MRFQRTRKFFRWAFRVFAIVFAIGLITGLIFSLRCRGREVKFQPSTYADQHPPQANGVANYSRPEEDTFYSYPEWYVVWSYQAKADFQRTHLPSHYTYFADIAQYWRNYCCIFSVARKKYPAAWGEHVMLVVIGTSFSIEYALKGAYEYSVGRFSEWTCRHQMTGEDSYAAQVAEDYARFVHVRPFYEYSFAHALRGLWTQVPLRGSHWFRIAERRTWLTFDYGVEAIYCELIELATHVTYGYADTTTSAWLRAPSQKTISAIPHISIFRGFADGSYIVEIPRYQEFTARALEIAHSNVQFVEIAGNRNVLISVVSDQSFRPPGGVQLVRSDAIPSEPRKSRSALLCQISDLTATLLALENQAVTIEHIYDF